MEGTQERTNLAHLGDMELEVVAEMGRLKMPLKQIRKMQVDDVIKMERLAGEAFDIRINNVVFAEGEIVVVVEEMACRITHLKTPIERQQQEDEA